MYFSPSTYDVKASTSLERQMFEFHGWAVIRLRYTADEAADEEEASGLAAVLQGLGKQIAATRTSAQFHLHPVFNGMTTLTVSGLRHHRQAKVIGIFSWLAQQAPGSYGLLYVLDDEDRRGDEYATRFRVFRLARGLLEEQADPFLSPPVPVVEDACWP